MEKSPEEICFVPVIFYKKEQCVNEDILEIVLFIEFNCTSFTGMSVLKMVQNVQHKHLGTDFRYSTIHVASLYEDCHHDFVFLKENEIKIYQTNCVYIAKLVHQLAMNKGHW